MWSLEHAARALGGEAFRAKKTICCPGPGHSQHDRSLSVLFDLRAPDGFVVQSFAGDDWRACRDHVRAKLGIGRPVIQRSDNRPAHRRQVSVTSHSSIWSDAGKLGAHALGYLSARGVAVEHLPDRIHDALRWHPTCPWGSERKPCLVALWTDIGTGAPRAIHRRPIADGKTLAHWRALGPTTGCIIRLWPNYTVEHGLVLGEGVETVLAAATRVAHRGTLLQPAWAAGDAGHIAAFPVLPGIGALTLLVDKDATGQRDAAQCSARWTTAGREVVRMIPRSDGADFAGVIAEARR